MYAENIQSMALNFTKNQILILEIFFNRPEKSYYLRELGRIIDKEPGVFQKDINNLVSEKILISEFQANSRFFKLNPSHPLFNELKSIFLKTFGVEGRLRKILGPISQIKIAFIFGSFAQNKEDAFSDIDLMIIGNPDEDKLIKEISPLESRLDREINYHIFSTKDWKKHFKKKDTFLESIIDKPKIYLIGDANEFSRLC